LKSLKNFKILKYIFDLITKITIYLAAYSHISELISYSTLTIY
jgi:hypothetical protein